MMASQPINPRYATGYYLLGNISHSFRSVFVMSGLLVLPQSGHCLRSKLPLFIVKERQKFPIGSFFIGDSVVLYVVKLAPTDP